MHRNYFVLSFGLGIALLATNQSSAQGAARCAERSLIVHSLAEKYGESRQSVGLGNDNTLVEVFASEETGSWSITVTRAGGPTCLVAAGNNYQLVQEALPTLDSGA